MTSPDAESSPGAAPGELALTVTESGVLVTGDPGDVSRYIESVRSLPGLAERPFTSSLADGLAASTALASVAASSGEYVQLSQRSLELLRAHGAIPGQAPGTFRGFVRNAQGEFAGNLEFSEVSLAANQAAALQLAAATVALKVAIAKVEQAVERVEGKLDGLVTLENAKLIGEVVAHHDLLAELTDTLDRTGHLPVTDWQTVAQLGVAVPTAIAQLRQTAMLRIGELDGAADASTRARKLRDVVDSGQVHRALTLLVVAEDSYYRWQRVRLEHARRADPEHLGDMAERATAQLAADMRADRELIDLLDTKLVEYAAPKPLEKLHPFATRDLAACAKSLHDDLVAFADARRAQVHRWEPLPRPTWAEAGQEARARAVQTRQQVTGLGRDARRAIGRTLNETRQGFVEGLTDQTNRARAKRGKKR